jgi:glc operon protein GlcG
MSRAMRVFACLGGMLSASAGGAQQAPSESHRDTVNETAPQPAPAYGAPITLSQAKAMAVVIEAEAARMKKDTVVFAIVQPSGDLVYFEKMDGSTYVSIQYAQMKARMAARYRVPSGNLPPNGSSLPDAIALGGGLPIVYRGRTIGGIGISGVEEHGAAARFAQAAIDALNNDNKR